MFAGFPVSPTTRMMAVAVLARPSPLMSATSMISVYCATSWKGLEGRDHMTTTKNKCFLSMTHASDFGPLHMQTVTSRKMHMNWLNKELQRPL
jgi:hypothetical protein